MVKQLFVVLIFDWYRLRHILILAESKGAAGPWRRYALYCMPC